MLYSLREGGEPCRPGQHVVCTVGACLFSTRVSKISATADEPMPTGAKAPLAPAQDGHRMRITQQTRRRSENTGQQEHPDYWRPYRRRPPHYAESNRRLQQQRDCRSKNACKDGRVRPNNHVKAGTYYLLPGSVDLAKMDTLAQKITLSGSYSLPAASCKQGLDCLPGPTADKAAMKGGGSMVMQQLLCPTAHPPRSPAASPLSSTASCSGATGWLSHHELLLYVSWCSLPTAGECPTTATTDRERCSLQNNVLNVSR